MKAGKVILGIFHNYPQARDNNFCGIKATTARSWFNNSLVVSLSGGREIYFNRFNDPGDIGYSNERVESPYGYVEYKIYSPERAKKLYEDGRFDGYRVMLATDREILEALYNM